MPAVGGAQGCGQCQARSVKCEYPSPSRRRTRKWGGNDDQGSSSTPTSGLDLRNTTQSPQHHAQITPRPASDSARDSGKHRQEFAGQGRSRSVSPHRERPSFVKDGSMYDLDSILESASNPPSIDEININLGPSDMDLILQQANELFYPDFTDARPPPRIPEHSFVGPSDESLVRYLPRSQSSTNYLDKLPSHGSYDIIPMEVSVKRGRGRPKGSRNKQAVPAPAGEASSSAPPRKRGRPPKEKTEGGKAEDKSGSSDDLIQIRRA
ncbi:hypothetical protein B0H17DRAFT_1325247 [Mycena rosella]|uniref:Zn(2)-C6 fungal-type domain-containing protein n=1 Tax=Mycena rosella TaxID=1033263 RepID=A0AAD7GXA9_MYCRO|nr:hypothetical protein B0H17DRAFT_1325247 [Mycena rosella]